MLIEQCHLVLTAVVWNLKIGSNSSYGATFECKTGRVACFGLLGISTVLDVPSTADILWISFLLDCVLLVSMRYVHRCMAD